MGHLVLPPTELVDVFVGGALGALTVDGNGPGELQLDLLQAVMDRFGDRSERRPVRSIELCDAATVRSQVTDPELRHQLANLVITLELTMHPLQEDVQQHAERFLVAAGVRSDYLHIVRDTAEHHLVRLHADLLRNSWYTEQTLKGLFSGRLGELLRSKLSYYSVTTDPELAARWSGLRDLPDGTWGREVARFYDLHGFPMPGEHGGIYEVGALHDWVHVLTDYGTAPEGEIDVFAFIAATMQDQRGFVQFVFTLALFQNGSVDTVGGKHIPIARADTLDEPGAVDRLADAFWRASRCTADVMGGVDHFALADVPLADLRERWNIPPKGVPGPGAFDRPQPGGAPGADDVSPTTPPAR